MSPLPISGFGNGFQRRDGSTSTNDNESMMFISKTWVSGLTIDDRSWDPGLCLKTGHRQNTVLEVSRRSRKKLVYASDLSRKWGRRLVEPVVQYVSIFIETSLPRSLLLTNDHLYHTLWMTIYRPHPTAGATQPDGSQVPSNNKRRSKTWSISAPLHILRHKPIIPRCHQWRFQNSGKRCFDSQ